MINLRKRLWTPLSYVNLELRLSSLWFCSQLVGGIQSSWRCLRTHAAVQEASKASSDGQLLSEGCSCLLESRELLISCMHSASAICVVKGTETYNDNRGTAEVSKSLECFFCLYRESHFSNLLGRRISVLNIEGKNYSVTDWDRKVSFGHWRIRGIWKSDLKVILFPFNM